MIVFVWAMDENTLIGNNNSLPWHIPEELQHFKALTINQTILMGRKTFESIGRVLPNRETLILTRNKNYHYDHPDVEVVYSIKKLIKTYFHNNKKNLYVCGGAEIFALFLPYAEKLIVSIIKGSYKGDIYFPKIDFSMYNLIERKNNEKFNILYYQRREK